MSINIKDEVITELTYKDILKILPHRYPFLLIDKVTEVNLEEKYILGQKNTSLNEEYFQGHFPGMPIMPAIKNPNDGPPVSAARVQPNSSSIGLMNTVTA